MERIKSKTQRNLYDFIVKQYLEDGKFTYTNRQLGVLFERTAKTMQYNIRILQEKGYIRSKTVVEPSGYVIRYVTPRGYSSFRCEVNF